MSSIPVPVQNYLSPEPGVTPLTYSGQAAKNGAWGAVLVSSAYYLPPGHGVLKTTLYVAGGLQLVNAGVALYKIWQCCYPAGNVSAAPSAPVSPVSTPLPADSGTSK